MNRLERIDKQISLLENVILIYRSTLDGWVTIGRGGIDSDLQYLYEKRTQIIKQMINKFKFGR